MALPTDPYTFVDGTTADADEVNARFDALFDALSAGGLDAEVLASQAWTAEVPSLTGVTGASNTVAQRYAKLGRTVILQGQLTLGSGGALSADPTILLPHAASATPTVQIGQVQAFISASSLGLLGYCAVTGAAPTVLRLRVGKPDFDPAFGKYVQGVPAALSATFPVTWTSGDALRWAITYEAAS